MHYYVSEGEGQHLKQEYKDPQVRYPQVREDPSGEGNDFLLQYSCLEDPPEQCLSGGYSVAYWTDTTGVCTCTPGAHTHNQITMPIRLVQSKNRYLFWKFSLLIRKIKRNMCRHQGRVLVSPSRRTALSLDLPARTNSSANAIFNALAFLTSSHLPQASSFHHLKHFTISSRLMNI